MNTWKKLLSVKGLIAILVAVPLIWYIVIPVVIGTVKSLITMLATLTIAIYFVYRWFKHKL